MWIVPNNLKTSSAFAADTLASSEDLALPELQLERSLMWRSKPSPLPTWSRRWKQTPWLRHLSGRILKPSQHTCFEIELKSLHLAIPASLSQPQESAPEKMTPATSGHTSRNISKQSDLFSASLRTSKDTSASDCEKSSKTWKALVMQRRGEYSARLKSARLIRESESISLPTPSATSYGSNQGGAAGRTGKVRHSLESMAKHDLWPTPLAGTRETSPKWVKTREGVLSSEPNLAAAVLTWPTPRASEYKDCGPVGSKSQIHMEKRSYLCAKVKDPQRPTGCLNPNWVEWLMGVPTGWTDLGSWATA